MSTARQLNRAQSRQRAARLDFWEAGYFYPGPRYRERRTAKRDAKRATRRASRLLCKVDHNR